MNRLKYEKSPYLLQHASNPVDWYPWCDEAFKKAKDEDKPIFLSIGYSTCHWCHVMEKESFEDEKVAELLNRYFVNIKVDREERPDIDAYYMTVCQAFTGRGGWPLSIFMTPEKDPFFAATYIPKDSRFGTTGLTDLLPRLAIVWKSRKTEVFSQAHKIRMVLKEMFMKDTSNKIPENITAGLFNDLKTRYDEHFGGFANAPKFPSLHNVIFLLRYFKSNGTEDALKMASQTLKYIYLGGIHDHLAGGFHRYSTDRMWILPHFEKMLYDQSMAIWAFTEAYKATGNLYFRETVENTITFITNELASPEGAFYTAYDADSEGEEGKYYLWSKDEILGVLGKTDGELFSKIYNIKEEGNFREEHSGRFTKKNILYLSALLDDIAEEISVTKEYLTGFLKDSKEKLLRIRKKRIPPFRDDKILTDMNGLAISSLSIAYKYLKEPFYLSMAQKAMDFILERLCKNNQLYHSIFNGEVRAAGFLDDYAYIIFALLELFDITQQSDYLKKAVALSDRAINDFISDRGGFYLSSHGELPVKTLDAYDGAIPSGNSVMAMNLLRLSHLTGNPWYERISDGIFRCFASEIAETPSNFAYLIAAYGYATENIKDIIIAGHSLSDMSEFIDMIWTEYNPFVNMIVIEPSRKENLSLLTKYIGNIPAIETVTAFVCSGKTCSEAITDKEVLKKSIT